MDEVDESAYWHAMADVEFGPCQIEGCPTSEFATTDLEALWAGPGMLVPGHPGDERLESPQLGVDLAEPATGSQLEPSSEQA